MDSRGQAESKLKMKTFHATKCRVYPQEKLNTSKGVIRSRELASATEEEIASALGKQEVTSIRRISIRKSEERIQTNTYILTFNQPHNPKEMKIGYCLESSTSQHPRGASNTKNMNTTGKAVEDDRHVPNPVKRTQTTWRKIAWRKLDVETADKILRLTQLEILEVKHKRNVSFLKARKIVGAYMEENIYASVERRADTNHQDKYRTLMEKLI